MITILGAGGLSPIIENFGVSIPLLVSQFINFILVILILNTKFLVVQIAVGDR